MNQNGPTNTSIAWQLGAWLLGALLVVFLLQRFGFRFVVAYGRAG